MKSRVNARLERADLSEANIDVALEQISAKSIRRCMQKQLTRGQAHYKETYLLEEMMSSLSNQVGQNAHISPAESQEMPLSDPTAVRALVSPEAKVTEIHQPLKWIALLMALYYHGVPLRVLAKWFGVHKTTVLRWIIGLSMALWPLVNAFVIAQVKGTIVYIDEKWIKIVDKDKRQMALLVCCPRPADGPAVFRRVDGQPESMGLPMDRRRAYAIGEDSSCDDHRWTAKLSICCPRGETYLLSVSPSTRREPMAENAL